MCQDICKKGEFTVKGTDIIIIGSGIAALQLACQLKEQFNVMIITKGYIKDSNSYRAQGGIAAAISATDSLYDHYMDTITAADEHGHAAAIHTLVTEGRQIIKDWIRVAPFDMHSDGNIALGLEGAHSKARITHCGGDQTGKYMTEFLLRQLYLSKRVQWLENKMVIDLLQNKAERCIGVITKDIDGSCHTYVAPHVVLATGGAGELYASTSNTWSVAGDGVALAYRVGAKLSDMEFFQFHPTLLHINGRSIGLVSEAVRGAGATLKNDLNEQFMVHVHPLGDLAPRHIVAHEIFQQIKAGRKVYLDITPVKDFSSRFPAITNMCKQHGVSIQKGKIPVVPGAHFMIGGVVIDDWGATSVKGLYAIGEVAASGVHGANRLASNSLLEGLVYGKRLAAYIVQQHDNLQTIDFTPKKQHREQLTKLPFTIQELQQSMMQAVGIIRDHDCLSKQLRWLDAYQIDPFKQIEQSDRSTIQVYFMWIAARLITDAALHRTETRGCHIRSDFPNKDNEYWLQKRIVHFKSTNRMEVTYDQPYTIKHHA
ncbi:L-aspartate oxidase [Virgibacillus pantothenticus]|nr:L-aspartate oxidase [Virgibacillus pantothenticus]MBU8599543.1 L-aspartate oxidase [Virgibacillus pantothenticus]MBU8633557.1 L-aspartate oxidase [Virgibacillus pantothenticus]MBU8641823.1 L-aspartate oxidase [Virgibacillus pantothenticus]MBU8645436.1 L-aspartate oxidase [Virgibacillus pantothenticus]